MIDSTSLAAYLPRFSDVRLLCVGDLMLDRFVAGEVIRISPEAPIPIFLVGRETAMLGGAGNVLRNATALGASACFVAVVGDDPVGRELTAMVGGEPRVEPYLMVERDRPSTVKTRYIAGAQQLLRADSETLRPITSDTAGNIIRVATEVVASCDAVVISDYAKGVLTAPVISAVIKAARAAGKPVVVDPKGGDFGRYKGATVLTPNRREAMAATGAEGTDEDAMAAMGAALIERFDVDAAVITRSASGMTLVTRDGAEHLPAQAREVFDVSGAGDTVAAMLAMALGCGADLSHAIRLANHAAGVVVGKVGTSVVYCDDLLRAIHAGQWSAAEAKVMSLAGAAERVEQWRRGGDRVGFTNGCFDLLHPGHISLIEQARGACDRLIVGLNSDDSVARLKGDGRPIQSEAARAQVLASLASVDLVVIYGEDTPLAQLETLRPDVLVKGADYAISEVVGAELVQGYGGTVLLADIAEGYSTTTTIEKMAR
jgi:D-beta-D-heptose 7-phosphate kinase/D-beta-D-heptose 1-phosphate adenosyltransferase